MMEFTDSIDLNLYDLVDIVDIVHYNEYHTYDIEVDQVHRFNARNSLNHNCAISHNSASICLFSKGDIDMMNAKTGNWYQNNPQRARSNNSVVLLRNDTSFDEFKELIERSRQFGEPGFYFSDDTNILTNPCVSGDGLIDVKIDGRHQKIEMRGLVDLIKNGQNIFVKSFNFESNKQEYNKISWGDMTRRNAKLLKITDTSTGKSIKLTPDHQIWTENRGWIEAKNLKSDDQLKLG